MPQTEEIKVRYYYDRIKQKRIRVEPVEFVTARTVGKNFNLKKFVEKVKKSNPKAAIVLDDFVSKQLNSLAQTMGFRPYMNFPAQLTLNINEKNSQILS